MASLPSDLSRKWWSDHKAATLKSTKLGESLGKCETALAETKDVAKRRYAAYGAATKSLEDLKPAVAVAKKECNTTLHKDTIKILDAYPAVIAKAANELMAHKTEYDKIVKDWADLRKRTKAGMVQRETEMDALIKKAETAGKLCAAAAARGDANLKSKAAAEAKKVLTELAAKQETINEFLSEARQPKDRHLTPHMDDYPGDAANLFNECVNIQKSITGKRGNAENTLKTEIEKAGG